MYLQWIAFYCLTLILAFVNGSTFVIIYLIITALSSVNCDVIVQAWHIWKPALYSGQKLANDIMKRGRQGRFPLSATCNSLWTNCSYPLNVNADCSEYRLPPTFSLLPGFDFWGLVIVQRWPIYTFRFRHITRPTFRILCVSPTIGIFWIRCVTICGRWIWIFTTWLLRVLSAGDAVRSWRWAICS